MGEKTSFLRRNRMAILSALICGAVVTALDAGEKGHFSWNMPVLFIAGFGVLFLLLSENHLLKREKTLFVCLRRDAGGLTALGEAFYQLLLAGLIFFLFYSIAGKKTIEGPAVLFFAAAALTGMLLVIHLPFSEDFRRMAAVIGYGVVGIYSLYILTEAGYIRWSASGQWFFGRYLLQLKSAAMAGIMLMGILEFRYSWKRAVLFCLVEAGLLWGARETNMTLMAEFYGILLVSNVLGKPRTTAKYFLAFFLSCIAFVAASFWMGWVDNVELTFSYAGITYGYGMGHSNLTALILMSPLLLIWYLFLKDHPVVTFLLCWPCAAGIWLLTYSRTVTAVLAVFPILNGLRYLPGAGRKLYMGGLVGLPAAFAGISLFCMYWVPTQERFSAEGNFFARFTIPFQAAEAKGIHLFGTAGIESFVIDNVFLHTLMFFGMIAFLLLPVLLTWVSGTYRKNGQDAELILFTAFLIYSMMENALIRMPFGFSSLLMAETVCHQPGRHEERFRNALRNAREPFAGQQGKTETVLKKLFGKNNGKRTALIGIAVLAAAGGLYGYRLVRETEEARQFRDGILEIHTRSEDSTLQYFRTKGFSRPEADYTWTDGKRVEMEIPISGKCEMTSVEISVVGIIRKEQPYTVLNAWDEEVTSGTLEGAGWIAFNLRPYEGCIRFSILLPRAAKGTWMDPNSLDQRMMALRINGITVRMLDYEE